MKLYHYTSYHTLCKYIIPHQQLKFGSIVNTNDPSESKPRFIYGESVPTKLLNNNADYYGNLFREEYRKYKFISFCSNNDSRDGFKISSMWAHYGRNHKGVCIEIDTDLLSLGGCIRGDFIDYTNDISGGFFDVSDFYKTFEKNIKMILFSKSKEWEYEQEYRLITKDLSYLDISNALTAIYCGCRMCKKHIIHIESFGYKTKQMRLSLFSRKLTDDLF